MISVVLMIMTTGSRSLGARVRHMDPLRIWQLAETVYMRRSMLFGAAVMMWAACGGDDGEQNQVPTVEQLDAALLTAEDIDWMPQTEQRRGPPEANEPSAPCPAAESIATTNPLESLAVQREVEFADSEYYDQIRELLASGDRNASEDAFTQTVRWIDACRGSSFTTELDETITVSEIDPPSIGDDAAAYEMMVDVETVRILNSGESQSYEWAPP
jgi:hypothetical protein